MGLSNKIVSILVGASVLTFWTLLGGLQWYEQFLAEQEIQIGHTETVFSSYVLLFTIASVVTYLLMWRAGRGSE